jgi:hypothetical protein
MGWFVGHTWKNNTKCCTSQLKLLCNFHCLHVIYKYDCGPRNTTWLAVSWRHTVYKIALLCLTRCQKVELSVPEHLNDKLCTLHSNVTLLEVPAIVGHFSFVCHFDNNCFIKTFQFNSNEGLTHTILGYNGNLGKKI